MGGKHKQAQRIKNNARPSSSGRSAELLASSSSSNSQFSSVKEIRFIPPTLSLLKTEEFDASVTPDFQIVFKKMNKRDPTTKLKALQEFSELVSNTNLDTIKTILAFWSTLYNILATDTDHRIREAAHNAHLQIILRDKKVIAPFLKQLIGPWFTSQYDTYAPASTAAVKSFSTAFPANKVQDCVIYCQKEILTYISENLSAKIDQKSVNNEEAEAKFERVIVSSLQGYSLYLHTLTNEQISKCLELNREIVANQTFFKLATHKSCLIRSAWFKVTATLYHIKAGFLLDDLHHSLVPLVFGNLDETEPGVVCFVWEAVLLIMDLGEEWYKHINVDRMYLSKLKKVLRDGGNGNALVIYPNLLSLLHHLPSSCVNCDTFYSSFFENMRLGLKRRSVTTSKSESTAIVTALIECLQYVVLNNKSNEKLCENLISTHILPLIEWSLNEKQISYRVVFNQVSVLVQYWNRNETMINYSTFFWNKLRKMFERIEENTSCDYFERQITFLQHLKNVSKPKEKVCKVKFSLDVQEDENVKEKLATGHGSNISQTYNDELKSLVFSVFKAYVTFVQETNNETVLQHIFGLVQLFESKEFLLDLCKYLNDKNLIDIYKKILYEWLKTDGELCSEIVVDMSFILFKYLEVDEKEFMLNSFLEFHEKDCFAWFIKNSFSYPHYEDVLVQNWVRNSKISEFLVKIAEKNIQNDCPAELKTLFKLAFTETHKNLLIDSETVQKIVEKLIGSLANPSEHVWTIDSCAHLASFVSEIIYTENSQLKYGNELILALFKFSITDHSELETLTSDTLWEVTTSWQDALVILSKNLPREELLNLTVQFGTVIETNFLENYSKESEINRLSEGIVNLFRSIFNGQPLILTDIYKLLFKSSFYLNWKRQVVELCSTAEYLNGNLASKREFTKSGGEIEDGDVLKYFIWKNILISSILCNNREDDDDDDDEIDSVPLIYSIDEHISLILEFLYDISLADSFTTNLKTISYIQNVKNFQSVVQEKLKIHLQEQHETCTKLKNELLLKLESESWLWSKAIRIFHSEIMQDSTVPFQELFKFYTKNKTSLHLIQSFRDFLTFDDIHLNVNQSICENAVILRSLVRNCDEIDVQIAQVFNRIKKLRQSNIPKFLYEIITDLSWSESEEIIETVRLLTSLVKYKFDALNRQHWDFGVISLSSWTANCYKMRKSYENVQIQALFVAISDYFIVLNEKMNEFKVNNVRNSFVDEWEDLFLPNIQVDLVQLWMYLADQLNEKHYVPSILHPFIQKFGCIAEHVTYKLILSKDPNSPNWKNISTRCLSLLFNDEMILQLWAYKMLNVLIPGLIEIDLESVNSTNTKGYLFEQFQPILAQLTSMTNDILAGFKLGEDSCSMQPFHYLYTTVFGYVLVWSILLKICDKSPPELRYQYADLIKNENHLKSLLNNLFKLMPAEVLENSDSCSNSSGGCVKTKTCFKQYYQQEPILNTNESPTSELLEHFVCWVYSYALTQLPALVRQWWSETDTKITQIVERVTSFYVSPQLCQQELLNVTHHETKFKNMTIKTIQSVREVIAIYTVDEAQMELVITLPQNYPLGGPDVRCNRQIGGGQHKQWLMQLKKCLLHQNGRIWDGLSLWNANLDKKFDGVEECYICFAVLHPGTYQLPKLSCQTCKKKFHSACLYKWFSTSNKSSCPICRNLF